MKKCNCILLVDDSLSTNIYHKKIIEKAEITNHIRITSDGLEALNYLNDEKAQNIKPDIIFLDINMPKMDGFEFLEEYAKLPKLMRKDIIIVLLTTSNWSKDRVKATETKLVYDYIEKPLDKEDLIRISNYYLEEL
ncbi:response regulator [Winogradskyella luteola]|uniref:Response regulator n=1 Tax=Winogradskyella luteola TaxID=2828330 RepID=A0A9X1F8P9_9FLAO|nr:response regulator [Winogradskyella luteola]MBV7269234.1 response regulator [Winogradskyella luteola]